MTRPLRGTFSGIAVGLLASACAIAEDPPPMRIAVRVDEKTVSVGDTQKPALVYRFGDVPYKPYIQEFRTNGGINILRDAPHDHLHHHALMFAIGVSGVDFWGEFDPQKFGYQRQVARKAPAGTAEIEEQLEWRPAEGAPLLLEKRTITLNAPGSTMARLLTWRSQLSVPPANEAATLFGSHYFGLGMRFIVSMDKGGEFLYASKEPGKVVRGTELLTPGPWCAYRAKADGKPVTVAMFDHPKNAPRPVAWFTMTKPFAYLSATLKLHEKPLVLEKGKTLDLVYGVALWDGHFDEERIAAAYEHWLSVAKPSGKQ